MFPPTQEHGQGLGDSMHTDSSQDALLCPSSNSPPPPRERREIKALLNFT